MAINLTQAWTASSLTPSFQPAASGSLVPAAVTPNFSGLGNLLSNILGPNFQSLLGGQDMSGQFAPPASPQDQANLTLANAYSSNLAAKNQAMSAYQTMVNQVMNPQTSYTGNDVQAQIQKNNAFLTQQSLLPGFAKISQAAALSPTYAPQLQGAVGQQNNGASWNPYRGTSGWVSPAMNNQFAAFQDPLRQNPAYNLMSMGA